MQKCMFRKALIFGLVYLMSGPFLAIENSKIGNPNRDLDVVFTGCGAEDNEVEYDIGEVNAFIDSNGILNISVSKAYSLYKAYVNFTVKNTGTSPNDPIIYLKSRPITNPPEISVELTDFFTGLPIPINTPLAPGAELEGLITITILDGADQLESYEFDIVLNFDDITP